MALGERRSAVRALPLFEGYSMSAASLDFGSNQGEEEAARVLMFPKYFFIFVYSLFLLPSLFCRGSIALA